VSEATDLNGRGVVVGWSGTTVEGAQFIRAVQWEDDEPTALEPLREDGLGDTEAAAALRARGAEIVALPGDDLGIDPAALFAELGRREVNEVHVEAGPTLCGRLLETGYVDELIVYMAPQVLGDSARGLFAMTPLASMAERTRLHLREVRHVGSDLRIQALPLIDRE
jgi:riboflavin biosynthesis pyrimidine reductase